MALHYEMFSKQIGFSKVGDSSEISIESKFSQSLFTFSRSIHYNTLKS